MFLSMLVCACFSLRSNHQFELAERQGFLLKLRETLRADRLRIEGTSLLELSNSDPSTLLSNRRAFDAKLAELWCQTQNHGQPFSLLMIDVDFFKKFNDQDGYLSGDTCLKQVAGALRSNVIREEDVVVRYRGEEVSVLLAVCKARAAAQIAERLRGPGS
nr:diguanylate cyclase [Methylobacterium sp. BTF04]